MSEEFPDLAESAEPAVQNAEMIHPQAVDFLVHAIGLDPRFQLLSQDQAVILGNRIFSAYWRSANAKAPKDSLSADKIDLDAPAYEGKLKPGAITMLRSIESSIIQARRYVSGESIAALAQRYYPSAPGSSRVAAVRSLSQNIRTTATGIAHLNRTLYKGNLLGTIIEEWRTDDPDSLPVIFASNSAALAPAPTLDEFDGQLPHIGPELHLGIVAIARTVTDSPFPRAVSPPLVRPSRTTSIPAVPTHGASRADILAARGRRIAAMRSQQEAQQLARAARRASRDNGATPQSQ